MSYYIRKNGVTKRLAVIPQDYPAELVSYDNTSSGLTADEVQGAIDEINSTKVSKSGDTMSGNLSINVGSSTTAEETSWLLLGNNKAKGTVGNSTGVLCIYGSSDKSALLLDDNPNGFTANRRINIPDKSGTLALTSDIPTHGATRFLSKYTSSSAGTLKFTLSTRSSGLIFVNRNAASASIYAFYSTSNTGDYSFSKIAGADLTITCTDTRDINVTVNNYSNVTLMAVGADIT